MATLQTLVTGKGYDASQGIIEEVSKVVPEIAFFDAVIIPGTTFQSVSQTSDPTTGFRSAGNGIAASDEGYALRNFATGILSGLVQRDKAVVKADVRGVDATLLAAAISTVRSGLKTLAASVWYGDSTSQFSGVSALVQSALTVKAGGNTANGCSSVYAVGKGDDKCHLVFNEDSALLNSSVLEWKEGLMAGSNNQQVPCYWTDLTAWAGFAARNYNAMARLCNLDGTATLTDAMLAELVSKYAEANDGQNPDALFMTFDQRLALQKSRGTVVRTGARSSMEISAAVPLEYDGIPIFATNSIKKTEAVVA